MHRTLFKIDPREARAKRQAAQKQKKTELEKRLQGADKQEQAELTQQLGDIDKDIEIEDTEEKDEERRQKEEEEKKRKEKEEEETKNLSTDQIMARLVAGLSINRPLVNGDDSNGVGLRPTELIIGWKNEKGSGEVGVVADIEFPRAPIFRIKKVPIPENTRNIIDSRCIGCVKRTENPRLKWGRSDFYSIEAIALTIPPEYTGLPENLVISQYSRAEAKARREQKQPVLKIGDVQINIV